MAQDFKMDLHFQASALMALQEATEDFIVRIFKDANLYTIHCQMCN